MTVTKERFEQGMTYADYKAHMTRNRERLEANEQSMEFDPADLAFFQQLPQPLNVLVLAEDWCGDVIAYLPVLGRLAAESGKLTLRIFPRDQHLDLMALYLNHGQFQSIPVFAFFDQDFKEIGHWIERPARISEMMAQMREDLFKYDPAFAGIAPDTPIAQLPEEARMRLGQAFATFREENRGVADHEAVREIRALIARGLNLDDTPAAESAGAVAQSAGDRKTKHTARVRITYCSDCGYE